MSDGVVNQKRNLPLLATRERCAGKTFIVTGANVGLGFEAAKHLAVLGAARVVLGVRTPSKGEIAKADIDAAAGTAGSGVVSVWPLDLESFDSVRAFVRRADQELERIDAVVENAAVALAEREMAEGHVKPVTVNVLSTLLMAVLLVPVMRAKAEKVADGVAPRITLVTSRAGFDDDAHAGWEKVKEDPIKGMDAEDMVPVKTYPLSKVTETIAVRHLAREVLPVEKGGVIINLVCPGLCITQLGRNAPDAFAQRLRKMHDMYGRTAEDGSRTLLHGAMAGVESHGKLLHSCQDGEPDVPDWVNELGAQKNTWEVIARELEAVEPGCVSKML
ncbi:uncharacterized protein B0H64DRAFT_216750 [Chaetomium fimeti]|uniref:Uncharacterized protein n=1 Tax=Chaetomium fimeti TaxID=1854472 RepID=A0AAE0HBQ4_9PEZI|nr:hypothetical protein B0H64DRAFT_216750 [Chaetomium fimeti]